MNYYATHWILMMVVKIVYVDILGYDTGIVYFWVQLVVVACILPILSHAIDSSHVLQKYLLGKRL